MPKKAPRTLTLLVTVPFPPEATRTYLKAYVKDAVEYWSGQDNPDDWTFYFARGRTTVQTTRRLDKRIEKLEAELASLKTRRP